VFALLALAASFAVAPDASAAPATQPVPSLAPRETAAQWAHLVRGRDLQPLAVAAGCRPLQAVFYAATDWLRLATKLAAQASPCAQYSVSIPPLVADKTKPRPDQAWRIRALGPSFHVQTDIADYHFYAAFPDLRHEIEDETAQLQQSREAQVRDSRRLETERDEGRRLLASLDAALKDQQSRLAALGRDEKSLLELLEKLRDVFADIPKQIAGAEPFAQQQGRLLWPLRGAASESAAGDSHGVLIAAAEGGEVHAVSHGRVVFADWLRGYGLLLIVDHGDRYLSLYGCNETLLKDVGDWVNAGEVIATSGASGGRKTPGLYFELRHDGKPMDARSWLRPASRQR